MTTLLYAAVFSCFYFGLTLKTILYRKSKKQPYGTGYGETLNRPSIAHDNFSSYIPFSLVLMFLIESHGLHACYIHALCMSLLLGRISHFYGICFAEAKERPVFLWRIIGMQFTLWPLLMMATVLFYQYFK